MRVTVWGTGAWGVALAEQIGRAGHDVLVYTRSLASGPGFASRDAATGPILGALTDDLALAAESDHWLVATPMPHLEGLAMRLRSHVRTGLALLSCVKGLAAQSGERPTQVLTRLWAGAGQPTLHALGGPNLAHEVAQGLPAAAVLAGPEEGARIWQEVLGGALVLSRTQDVAGVEYGGALKNVVVIVTACTRLLYGENAAAVICHGGFEEMRRVARAAGAWEETLLGLSGLGDLLVTHASTRSRNRRCGEAIARRLPLPAWLESQGSVAEGVGSARGADRLASRLGLEVPVLRTAVALVEGAEPRTAVADVLVPGRVAAPMLLPEDALAADGPATRGDGPRQPGDAPLRPGAGPDDPSPTGRGPVSPVAGGAVHVP